MVMTWLMNSMNEEIGSNYMCYSTAKELWDNVNQMIWDLFNDYKWKFTDDANHYKQTMEAHRIYKFLVRFNVEFDEVRGGIIGRVPLPKISEVFAEVRRKKVANIFQRGPGEGHGSSAIIVTNRATLEKHAGKSMENQQIGITESPKREAIVQIPRPMLLSMNQSQVPSTRSR
ncbi:hypothetical protein CK203_095230 [Vitis vinifera]|uniref:Retrotransposon gag domain-containing protein n=1 Tax=Vitis vinifera TaxID=29760 RepID=A0A438BPV4_VITVI|nr:hypothetical protein CK203_095230 [Vitis vinifera]